MTDAETLRSIVEAAWQRHHNTDAVVAEVAAALKTRAMLSVRAEAVNLAVRTECSCIMHDERAAIHASNAPDPKPTQRGPDVIASVQGSIDYSYLRDYRISVADRGAIGLGECTPEEVAPAAEHMMLQAKGCLVEGTFLAAIVNAGKPGALLKATLTEATIGKLYAEAKKRCK